MATVPTTTADRIALRDRLTVTAIKLAIHTAIDAHLSIRCIAGNHAPDGCQNTGTGCLCECHDTNTTEEDQ